MGMRPIDFVSGEYYHLYNRGVEKRTIFLDGADYQRFLKLLYLANTTKTTNVRQIMRQTRNVYEWDRDEPLVAIGAYCLMPNHFHLLVTPLAEAGISQFMSKLCTSYSMYFNKRYQRSGALFQGKFKAKYASEDEYLKYLFSYIHLNPVKLIQSDWKERGIQNPASALAYATSYHYSSLQDVPMSQRIEGNIIDLTSFPGYFQNTNDIQSELLDWLIYQEN